MTDRRIPTSTYRLQLHAGFGFADAAAIVPYLARLGVSHLYLSPILQAAPGSMHGYDVVDHSRVSADLGGEDALVDLADRAHQHGLGIVVDVVPNHMAIPTPEHLNRQLWETLRLGRDSSTRALVRRRLGVRRRQAGPADAGRVARRGARRGGDHVRRARGRAGPALRRPRASPSHRAPSPTTSRRRWPAQHYALAGWREQDQILNYRRFFDVDTLIAVRVELEDVFDATHATLLDLHRRGRHRRLPDRPPGRAGRPAGIPRAAARPHRRGLGRGREDPRARRERSRRHGRAPGTTGYDAIRAIQASPRPRGRCRARRPVAGASAASRRTSERSSAASGWSSPTCSRRRSAGWPARRSQPPRRPANGPHVERRPRRARPRCSRTWRSTAPTSDRAPAPDR